MSKKQQDDKTGLRPESHKVTRRKFLSHSGAGAAGLGMLGTGLGGLLASAPARAQKKRFVSGPGWTRTTPIPVRRYRPSWLKSSSKAAASRLKPNWWIGVRCHSS